MRGGVWESVWGEWGSVLVCGERNGGGVGKCVWVWGPNTLPHISSLTSLPAPSPFPISPNLPHTPTHFPTPLISLPTSTLPPPTPQHIFLLFPHLPSYPTPQHIFLLSPHLPSPSQSVTKLLCDEVSVAKLLWRSHHVAKLLATSLSLTHLLLWQVLKEDMALYAPNDQFTICHEKI